MAGRLLKKFRHGHIKEDACYDRPFFFLSPLALYEKNVWGGGGGMGDSLPHERCHMTSEDIYVHCTKKMMQQSVVPKTTHIIYV